MVPLLTDWPVREPVPGISLRQPWASAVAVFGKDVENRKRWTFRHRGPLIIQASLSAASRGDLELFLKIAREDGADDEDLEGIAPDFYPTDLFPHGCIVAVVNLTGSSRYGKPVEIRRVETLAVFRSSYRGTSNRIQRRTGHVQGALRSRGIIETNFTRFAVINLAFPEEKGESTCPDRPRPL